MYIMYIDMYVCVCTNARIHKTQPALSLHCTWLHCTRLNCTFVLYDIIMIFKTLVSIMFAYDH